MTESSTMSSMAWSKRVRYTLPVSSAMSASVTLWRELSSLNAYHLDDRVHPLREGVQFADLGQRLATVIHPSFSL